MAIPTSTLITFIAYLIGMLAIGFWAWRKTDDLSDYILGGRGLNPSVTALSAGASDMSGWLLLGLPGAIYIGGLSEVWIGLGLIAGAYLNWKLVAHRLRVYSEVANNALTMPDYFEYRFHDGSKLLRVFSALVILVFFTFYTSSGMVAGATLFKNSFAMDYEIALAVGAIVIVSYTFLGGFLAVSWTDFFQGILMLIALVVAPVTVIYELGSLDAILAGVREVDPARADWTAGKSWAAFLLSGGFVSLMAWGLGYFGQPHILVRFMAIQSGRGIPTARRIGMTWMIMALIGSILVGFTGIGWFAEQPGHAAQLNNDPEAVFILMTQVIFNPWMAGFLLAAILAAVMSTIDSQLLVSSSALTEDFYKVFLRKEASQKELVWVGRAAVLGIALIAVYIAMDPQSRVLELVSYAWAGFGAAFGPLVLISLLWRKMTRNGALAGMLTGAVTVIIWEQNQGGIFDLYELLPGFVLASAAILVVSLLGSGPGVEVESQFDHVDREVKKQIKGRP